MNVDTAAKQYFLEQAKALSKRPKFVRYRAVTQLICDALAFGIRDDAEIFRAAYGDPGGKDYWDAYLAVAIPVSLLVNVLSTHSSENIEDLENRRFATLRAFRGAAEASEPWFVGSTNPILTVEEFGQTPAGLSKVRVKPRAAIAWLLGKPIFEHLVPESLQLFLQSETITAAATAEQPRKKGRPAFERALRVIDELYPDGVPDQATVSNNRLCDQVSKALTESVSPDTILRAARRRK